jgi:hypothetical protein
MSIKDLFGKEAGKVISQTQLQELYDEAESKEYLEEVKTKNERYFPNVDFSSASNFARYGSAESYYVDAIKNIYENYPYDGSRKEKLAWRNNSSYFDLYVFDNIYPKTTGFVILNSSSQQYVTVNGGPNKSYTGKFEDANLYDTASNRESNLAINPLNLGNTVEFWFKTTGSNASTYPLFDLWNGVASGSTNHARFLIQKNASGFAITYLSGASGVESAILPYTASLSDWHFYSFTVSSASAGLNIRLYVDGDFITSVTSGSSFGNIGNNANAIANIGSYRSGVGYVNGCFDEFRFWKEARSSKEISRFWFTDVGGGSNTDDSNTELGVYFKFNEGIVDTSSVNVLDTICLDYSGRVSNGVIINYSTSVRNTGSAVEAYSSEYTETPDPIIFSSNPLVSSTIQEYGDLGSIYDETNSSNIYKSLPTWITEYAEENELYDLKNLVQIISSYFDTLHIQIENLPSLRNLEYNSEINRPKPFISKILSSYGFENIELFNDTTFIEDILSRNETKEFEKSLTEIKNTIYQNIYNNLSYIYKSKGTEKSLRNLIRCFGIDDELIKVNMYANNATYELKDKFTESTTVKKYVDFNDPDRYAGTVYQKNVSGGSSNISYILGGDTNQYYAPITLQAEVIFPKKVEFDNSNYTAPDFTTVSLFGAHSAKANGNDFTWATNDLFNFQVYAEKRNRDSADVYFKLVSNGFNENIILTSSYFNNVYDNSKWNLAVRIKPKKHGNVDLVVGTSTNDYDIEFVGFNSISDTLDNSFSLSASLSGSNAKLAILENKRIYAGSHYQNFTGSLLDSCDVKITSVRYWLDYLTDEEIKHHSYDASNVGRDYPNQHPYPTLLDGKNLMVTKLDTLILNWNFDNVTGSDTNGQFLVQDAAYSLKQGEDYNSGFLGYVGGYDFEGFGDNFYPNDTQVVNKEYVFIAKQQNFETLAGSDLIEIRDTDDVTQTRNTKPISYYFSIEKSMSQIINDEIMTWFATIKDFNNLIGEPINRYTKNYRNLEHMKKLFFKRVQNEPDFERFLDFYKWIDSSISMMIQQMIPASANVSENVRNIVESHLLERNKYENKLPTIELKGEDFSTFYSPITAPSYENGRAPNSPAGALWEKIRVERGTTGYNTPLEPQNDIDREIIRQVINSTNLNKAPRYFDQATNTFSTPSVDKIRFFSKAYKFTTNLVENVSKTINPVTVENRQITSQFVFAANSVTSSGQVVSFTRKYGNYQNKYEYFQASSRNTNNKALIDIQGTIDASGSSSAYVSGVLDRALPERKTVKTIFVERFSAPGGAEVTSRGALDAASEEFSVYNSLNNRNYLVRRTLKGWLAESSSIDADNPSYHKVNKNNARIIVGDSVVTQHDNEFIVHQIPRSDVQYSWITASVETSPSASGFVNEFNNLNIFNSSSFQLLSASVIDSDTIDYLGLNTVITKSVLTGTNTIDVGLIGDNLNKYLLNMKGPYGNSTWKQIRGGENKLVILAKKNNKILVQDRPKQKIREVRNRKNGRIFTETYINRQEPTFTEYVEPPVSYNKPMKHVLRVSSSNPELASVNNIEILSTYDNNKQRFANQELIKATGVGERQEEQTHDILSNIQQYGIFEPAPQIVSAEYEKVIFPKKEKAGTKETRQRPEYAEVAGTGSNGYDRNIAKIRSFWRNNREDRFRTIAVSASNNTASINSLNFAYLSSSYTGTLVYTASFLSTYATQSHVTFSIDLKDMKNSIWAVDSQQSISGNFINTYSTRIDAANNIFGEIASYKEHEIRNLIMLPSGSYDTDVVTSSKGFITTINTFQYANINRVLPRPQFLFINHKPAQFWNYSYFLGGSGTVRVTGSYYAINDGFVYKTDELSNNSAWYNSYDEYFEDIKPYSSKHSLVPEFRINDFMEYYLTDKKGDFTAPITGNYLSLDGVSVDYNDIRLGYNSTDTFNNFILKSDNFKNKKIKINLNAVKKLLPYKGFYPQERAVQVVDLFRNSFIGLSSSQIMNDDLPTLSANNADKGLNGTPFDQQITSILQPYFAPGVLFNTIKACVAVDYPVFITSESDYNTGSSIYSTASSTVLSQSKSFYVVGTNYNHRIKFTDLLDIKNAIPQSMKQTGSIFYLNPTFYSMDVVSGSDRNNLRYPMYKFEYPFNEYNKTFQEKNKLYSLSINNYLAEIPKFFLKSGKLNNFLSKPQKDIGEVVSGTTYYMDVYIDRDDSFKTILDKQYYSISSSHPADNGLFDQAIDITEYEFYGPPTLYTTRSIPSNSSFGVATNNSSNLLRPPAYAPHAPHYLYGKSSVRLSYTATNNGKVTIKNILENLKVDYLTSSLDAFFSEYETSNYKIQPAFRNAMNLSASVNFKQITKLSNPVYDQYGNPIEIQDVNDNSLDVWSIQTIFETPALNFNNDLNKNANNNQTVQRVNNSLPLDFRTFDVVKMNTLGMWSGYGEVPKSGNGIKFGIEESFEKNLANTGSLIELCGFEVSQNDIGAVAETREISEGLIMIPYLEKGNENLQDNNRAKNILGIVGENGVNTVAAKRNGPFYFSINRNTIDKVLGAQFNQSSKEQLKKIIQKEAVNKENSIVKAINGMLNYNLPPQLDWVTNKNIDPFVMYFFEFKHTLKQQDLSDIWQGLMPEIAREAELDTTSFEHPLGQDEFFHGKELPEGIKFKIFKVKKKAAMSYYELTDDSSDDARFRFNFSNSGEAPEYSYNYPYDFFSLVELVNIEAGGKVEE